MTDHSSTKPLLLLGSSRKMGDTRKLACRLFTKDQANILDLLDYKLYHYDYAQQYPPDDAFADVVKALLRHRVLVLATPVYWYSMSGQMKVFFDRLTDLVTTQKKLGRQLKGKSMFLLAVGADKDLPAGFEQPFRLTAQYLDMSFAGSCYCAAESLNSPLPASAVTFKQKVLQQLCA